MAAAAEFGERGRNVPTDVYKISRPCHVDVVESRCGHRSSACQGKKKVM